MKNYEPINVDELRKILKFISKDYDVPSIIKDTLFKVAVNEIEKKHKKVLLKRDPNISKTRIQAAYVKIIDNNAIEIHPSSVGGYGADFDGDTCFSYIKLYYFDKKKSNNLIPIRIHISEFINNYNVELESEKTKDDGVIVKNYKVNDIVYVDAIDKDTGDISKKKVTHWSIHHNIKFYNFNRKKRINFIDDVRDIWISDNHSVIVYDRVDNNIKRITPDDILLNKENYYLIKYKETNHVTKISPREFLFHKIIKDDNITDEELGYFFGSTTGDGYVASTKKLTEKKSDLDVTLVGFSNSNDLISDKWSDICEMLTENKVTRKVDVKSNYLGSKGNWLNEEGELKYANSKRSLINDVVLAREYRDHFGRRSDGKCLPTWMMNTTDEFIKGFIAGYGDTDGTLNKQYFCITSKSEKLLKDLAYLLKYRFNIDSSLYQDCKKSYLDNTGKEIKTTDESKWRYYWIINISINNGNYKFFEDVEKLMVEAGKKEKLIKAIDNVKNKPARYCNIKMVPYTLIKDMSIKDRKELLNLTNDTTFRIKKSGYAQSNITIPSDIINNSSLPEATKNLLHKQNNNEIEFIPCECLDIAYDPNMTTGYDITVEDYCTFTTDEGIFIWDTMAVFAPISKEAQIEMNKMITTVNDQNINSYNLNLSAEMLVGLYTITYLEKKNVKPITIRTYKDAEKLDIDIPAIFTDRKGNKHTTTTGRIIFNSFLPNYIDFINEPVDKKLLKNILDKVIEISKADFANTIDVLCKNGFMYATLYPQSISIDMLIVPKTLYKLKEKLEAEKNPFKQQNIIDEMETELLKHLELNCVELYINVKSGAAKGISQLRQVMVAKGLINDANNKLLPAISKSMTEGYDSEEYFNASASSRKGVIDRAKNTAYGGYAYRKFVYACCSATADINNPYCGTKNHLNIKVNQDFLNRLNGRYKLDDKNNIAKVTKDDLGHVIKLLSPAMCASKSICRVCYGDLIYQLKSKNVGLIGVQSTCSLSESIMKCSDGLIEISGSNDICTMEELWENS